MLYGGTTNPKTRAANLPIAALRLVSKAYVLGSMACPRRLALSVAQIKGSDPVGDEWAEVCDGPEELEGRNGECRRRPRIHVRRLHAEDPWRRRAVPPAKRRGSVDGAGRLQCSLSRETPQAIKSHGHACAYDDVRRGCQGSRCRKLKHVGFRGRAKLRPQFHQFAPLFERCLSPIRLLRCAAH